jgi:hypothetical protein
MKKIGMAEKKRKESRTLFLFILLSILLHFLLGGVFYLIPKQISMREKPKEETQVVWVKPEFFQNNPTEIADIEKPAVEKRPEKSRFAGQYDSTVKEETVARPKPKPKVIQENPFSGEARPSPKIAKRTEPSPSEEKIEKPEAKKEEPEKTELEKPRNLDLGDLALKPQDVLKEKKKEIEKPKQEALDLTKLGPGLEYGRPGGPDMFQHDYYPDYKIGGKTYLNVMKVQDVAFFVKMKRILKMRWNPIPVVRDYYYSNHLTVGKIECVIGVSLNEMGGITELLVIRSSGLNGYDEEAMQTLRDSSPYSSPPASFMKDGQLRMSWTFTVYL